jgi:hypothetical protein
MQQIWLNCFPNDRHFGYIKKSAKETLNMWTSIFFTGKLLPKSDFKKKIKWSDFWQFEPFEDFYVGLSAVFFSWQIFSISRKKIGIFF